MNLLQHRRALLQPKQHILLNQRKLHITRQRLQLRQLQIRLRQQRLLVLLPPQRQQRLRLVTGAQTLPRDLLLARRYDRDALLVLPQLVALVLEVEDGAAGVLGCRG
jgi:hypothetical protein